MSLKLSSKYNIPIQMVDSENNNSAPEYHLRAPISKVNTKAFSSVLKISIEANNKTKFGSAFLGETADHQKLLFTAKHIFDSLNEEPNQLNFICENSAQIPIFSIRLDDYNKERVFVSDNTDSAAILLSSDIIQRCQNAGSLFVSIGQFVPHKKHITILGFPEGKDLSFSSGYITEFNEKEFSHTAGSLPGNSGSMILGIQGDVAGIHSSEEQLDLGHATSINYVIERLHRYFEPYYLNSFKTVSSSKKGMFKHN